MGAVMAYKLLGCQKNQTELEVPRTGELLLRKCNSKRPALKKRNENSKLESFKAIYILELRNLYYSITRNYGRRNVK